MIENIILTASICLLVGYWAGRIYERELGVNDAEATLRAKERITKENELRRRAVVWVTSTALCPECKTDDGLRNWYQDGMEVRGNYCHDPFHWHAARCKTGTYGGVTVEEALLKIGRKLK